MEKRFQGWFQYTGALLLFVLAAPLLFAATTRLEILCLELRDPFLVLKNRQVLYLVGGVEIAMSALLLLFEGPRLKWMLTAWLATNLFVYQGAGWFYPTDSLGALAHLTNRLPISPNLYAGFSLIVMGCLAAGSVGFLVHDWWASRVQARRPPAASAAKLDEIKAT